MSNKRYELAKQQYEAIGVDVDDALETLSHTPISMHCWQGDDLTGFENTDGASGGIMATGNYPGKAATPQELMADIDKAFSLIPGKHRLNLHAVYAMGDRDEEIDRSQLEPRHFEPWIRFAQQRGIGLDFNSTFFSHPMAADNLTLSHPNPEIRRYWIEHGKACRRIAAHIGKSLGSPCLHDIWIPDGYKDVPADRIGPRQRLRDSLDEILAQPYEREYLIDCVESKLFGLGLESYTVGSHEFYLEYAAHRPGVVCLLDSGHFHPTETVSDKLSSLLLFEELVALHVSRPVRWDSDHVVSFDDEVREIALELVRCNALRRVRIGLDFFDGSINRIAAWVIGMRNMLKALLYALLQPHETLRRMQEERRFTELLAIREELKTYPLGDIWDSYCEEQHVPIREQWLSSVQQYETCMSQRYARSACTSP